MPDFYGTAAGFTAYHTARGRDVSDYDDDTEINAALLVASEWLDGRYGGSIGGTKVGYREQVRELPRVGAMDHHGYLIPTDPIPNEAVYGTYEAAYRQLVTPGSLSLDWTPNKYKRASVDGAVSVEYASFNSVTDVQTQFAIIDQIMAPILSRATSSLSGAIART